MSFRSLTSRLIFWILPSAGAVYAIALFTSNSLSREAAVKAAQAEAHQEAERLANRVGGVLEAVEESTQFLGASLETEEPPRETLEQLLRRFVASEEEVYGSAAAYVPGAFGKPLFAPYAFGASTDPAELELVDLGAGTYGYPERDWYAKPAASGRPGWSEPYYDEGATGRAMVTYSVPFFAGAGAERHLRGVATADVRLDWLQEIIKGDVGHGGWALVLSREGRVLAHRSERPPSLEAPFVDQLPPPTRARLEPIVRHMLAGGRDFVRILGQEGWLRVLYRPVGRAGWSLAVIYPEQDFLKQVRALRTVQATIGAVGLLVLALVVVLLSRRLTAPLRDLSEAARGLAGNLDAELPPVRSQDELGALTLAFREMRDSLRRYVRELQETTAAKERLESELKIARRIQMDMLPRASAGSREEGYEVSAFLKPARDVGGDLYDHFAEKGRVFFLVADVSGKGVPAALFMARAKTHFEATAAHLGNPADVLAEVNRGLCRENEQGMYVTAVCGILETANGDLSFALAGHEPPIHLRRDSPPEPFRAEGGTVLGLLSDATFPLNRVRLEPGEGLVAFTDGVSEAFSASGELFGTDRLVEALRAVSHEEATAVTAAVSAAVHAFAAGAKQSDDITILTLRYFRSSSA